MKLTPVHLFRVGPGPDAVRVQAAGPALVVSTLGVLGAWGALDRLVLTRKARCWALYLGAGGVRWVAADLPPVSRAEVPAAPAVRSPRAPGLARLPALAVHLQVRAPIPP